VDAVGDLIGHHGTAVAGVVGPADHAGLEEGAVDDQLAAALEQVEQAGPAAGAGELVRLVHRQPWHQAALRRQRVPGPGEFLLLHEKPLARRLPFVRRHDRRVLHHGVRLS
jgi:hypothetical protein